MFWQHHLHIRCTILMKAAVNVISSVSHILHLIVSLRCFPCTVIYPILLTFRRYHNFIFFAINDMTFKAYEIKLQQNLGSLGIGLGLNQTWTIEWNLLPGHHSLKWYSLSGAKPLPKNTPKYKTTDPAKIHVDKIPSTEERWNGLQKVNIKVWQSISVHQNP